MLHHTPIVSTPSVLALLDTSEEQLHAQGVEPQELTNIYNDYLSRSAALATIAASVSQTLLKADGVYAVRHRIKDPLHLLLKIIRKKEEYPERTINSQNYLTYINDLAGVRVLHLYKEAWLSIAKYIQSTWHLKRPPYAYIRTDEPEQDINDFIANGCRVMRHPHGYKAVHFVIRVADNKQPYFVEIQVRTLFEEAWSEIDHNIRYPDLEHYSILDDLLQLLNKLTRHADDTASHIRKLAGILTGTEPANEKTRREVILQLQEHISKLPVEDSEKQALQLHIARLLKH